MDQDDTVDQDDTARTERVGERRLHRPHRLNALADGVFAIAMTLLALEIRVPEGIETEQDFVANALGPLLGSLAVFVAAFFIAGQYWLGHHRVMAHVHTVDQRALALSIFALVGVASLPVATSLITGYSRFPAAVAVAGGLLAATSVLSVRLYAHVLRPEFADVEPLTRSRYLVAPVVNAVVYLVSIGVAFLLPLAGVNSAWATLLWLLLPLNRPVTHRIVEHLRR